MSHNLTQPEEIDHVLLKLSASGWDFTALFDDDMAEFERIDNSVVFFNQDRSSAVLPEGWV